MTLRSKPNNSIKKKDIIKNIFFLYPNKISFVAYKNKTKQKFLKTEIYKDISISGSQSYLAESAQNYDTRID